MKSIKYLSFLLLPLSVGIAFTTNGWISYLPVFLFFGLLPILEYAFPPNAKNFDKETASKEKENKIYTYILYLTIPIQLFFLAWFFTVIQETQLTTSTYIGRVFGMGLMCGVLGINVGHELGHRNNRFDEFLGELLLLTSLNTHFLPYHNAGHHNNVATPKDAATARLNEPLYLFWIRSHTTSYLQAWQLENARLQNSGRHWFHPQNRMVIYTLCSITLLSAIFAFYGTFVLAAFILASMVGILLLETVNYIEHYGLLRKQKENGRYERVKRTHSWNSDHVLGRLMLFNLSRHSDHHYNGSKHYQLLNSVPESPQMPTGYPGMMLLALIPPLWFKFMNKKIQAF
ncbi:alkane 1-monooxygenase [Polaribacter pacificus]|uniref:Alkane 1-monooxygenase n=1 Tax=Polaribacter pacificus TaxID=1775173 RepID=A0A917MD24_9FLAO|nr:alkane 1-monooxygenase [Polaribacter pacificus]GGG95569.1 alkane 1-monooxygenase [Polaribacter pacificus]